MKKTLLLSVVCFLFALQSAMAYTTTTKLQLRAYDNSPISVNIDGDTYGAYTNSQSIENVAPGFHQMQVFALVANPYSGANTHQLIYSGGITIAADHEITAVINPYNNLQIISDVAMCQPTQPTLVSIRKSPVYELPHRVIVDQTPACPPAPIAMCEREFNDFMATLNNQWFESTKMEVAKQVLSSHYVTTCQVKQLMGAFTFESSKLDIAEFAYNRTVDQDRYYLVDNAFTFDSSISQLTCYINSQHHDHDGHDHDGNNYGHNHHDGYAYR